MRLKTLTFIYFNKLGVFPFFLLIRALREIIFLALRAVGKGRESGLWGRLPDFDFSKEGRGTSDLVPL